MLDITHENGMINIDTISNVRKYAVVLGRASQPSQRRPIDPACHHLETTRKTG